MVDSLQVGCDAAKEAMKTPLFCVKIEVIVDITQKGKMDSLLKMNIDHLMQSESFMDASTGK